MSTTILYLSHSADKKDNPDWWIVEPRHEVGMLRRQVEALLRHDRRVLQLAIWPLGGQTLELTDLPEDMQRQRLDEMHYRDYKGAI